MTGFKKSTMTIPNKLHGDRVVSAYIKGGVAVRKDAGAYWGVYHAAGGIEIYYRLARRTLKEVQEVAQQIIDLDVDWERAADDKRFKEQFWAAATSICRIADAPG